MSFDQPTLFLCAPHFYDIAYEINPWMNGNLDRVSDERSSEQWDAMRAALSRLAKIEMIDPIFGLPDLVFTANAGLVYRDLAIPSRFVHAERQGEEVHFTRWFREKGFNVVELPEGTFFEGAGDALFDRKLPILWAGYGFRSDLSAHEAVGKIIGKEVVALRLIDERFYHLDTCFCPLEGGYVMYYPSAFDEAGQRTIARLVPPELRIPVTERDALAFACNAVNVGSDIVLNTASRELLTRLNSVGFDVHTTPMSEFMLSGGAAKCLTLRLDEPPKRVVDASHKQENVAAIEAAREAIDERSIRSRRVRLVGHLLDSGLFGRILDLINEFGGSWKIEAFDPGTRRHEPSSATITVSAPGAEKLEDILERILEIGGEAVQLVDVTTESREIPGLDGPRGARLVDAEQDGVAPGDFFITTIYPTEVMIEGQWLRVARQRMDAVIVVEQGEQSGWIAECRLLRDVKRGDRIVCGVEGIRVITRKPGGRTGEGGDFGFMSSSVSSERRVEIQVEQIAWDMQRIRERGGRTVVVAGPVVVHTGGGPFLASLIRNRYVNALLGGNAIAVHDIEHSIYGTSLGVDLQRGVAITGGHKHHIRTINMVRRAGSIQQAVAEGLITRGIMYECVHAGMPFSLAGSIRDDGPLPETEMDLVKAQADYQRLIFGADMILMLSSMLHSIGTGNMTPAGVKLICVDINPAVVTKLADRGSQESVGIVTDVGLFLRLLSDKLDEYTDAKSDDEGPDA